MGIIRENFKYKIVKNFLTKEEINFLSLYFEIKHRANSENFDFTSQNNVGDSMFYGDPVTDCFLLQKQKLMEKETGKKLLPTYSFWRLYTKFAILPKHIDRPSCEISVTVNVNNDGTPWPIYMDDKPINLEKGEAAVYLGREVLHYRKEFQGDHHLQFFLHYVDAHGKYKDYYMDKRTKWGIPHAD